MINIERRFYWRLYFLVISYIVVKNMIIGLCGIFRDKLNK